MRSTKPFCSPVGQDDRTKWQRDDRIAFGQDDRIAFEQDDWIAFEQDDWSVLFVFDRSAPTFQPAGKDFYPQPLLNPVIPSKAEPIPVYVTLSCHPVENS